jgi:chromosome segregation ATPase
VKEYNITRSRWSGGAVTGIQQERLNNLKEQVNELKSRADRQRKELNTVAEQMNQLSRRLNSLADQVNEIVYRYNERFGEERTFHQGFYVNDNTQRKINIFQFNTLEKLRLVLAHEVGHALALRHVNNPQSVMYYKMEWQNTKTLQLTSQDIKAIRERCNK